METSSVVNSAARRVRATALRTEAEVYRAIAQNLHEQANEYEMRAKERLKEADDAERIPTEPAYPDEGEGPKRAW